MRRPRLEFFFDCSSPWTYLAFDRIEGVAADGGAELVWRPILVGGVFNTVNPSVYEQRQTPVAAKLHYAIKDMQDWARKYGLRIGAPPVFPVNSAKAMRGAFVAAEHDLLPAYCRKVFETYWGDLADISKDDILATDRGRRGARRRRAPREGRSTRIQGEAPRKHRRAHRARRLRLTDDVRGRRRHVLRKRSFAARARCARPRARLVTPPFSASRSHRARRPEGRPLCASSRGEVTTVPGGRRADAWHAPPRLRRAREFPPRQATRCRARLDAPRALSRRSLDAAYERHPP